MPLINKLITKVKGESYEVSTDLRPIQLAFTVVDRLKMLIRALPSKLILKGQGLLFLGSKAKIYNRSNIRMHGTVTLKHGAILDGRVKEEISIGNNFSLGEYSVIEGFGVMSNLGDGITFGDNVGIARNVLISVRGKVIIGNDVLIGPNTSIHAENHRIDGGLNTPIRLQGEVRKGITIEDNVWIGAKAVILDGVVIGHGSVVGAGSVVTKSIAPNSVVAGVPAKILHKRK